MKKLMFAAAVAATSMAFADAKLDAQAYDVSVSLKTTKGKYVASVNNKTNPLAVTDEDPTELRYRYQASTALKGLIWGCGCETIRGEVALDPLVGFVVWNTSTKTTVYGLQGEFGWKFINAIDKNGQKCEGVWSWADGDMYLVGAGFGSLKLKTDKDAETGILSVNCDSYVSTISGNVAGWLPAPYASDKGTKGEGCALCGWTPGTDPEEEQTEAWEFCACDAFLDAGLTAASGTWTVKYNSSVASKLHKDANILNCYKFPAAVQADILALCELSECDLLEKAYDAAKDAELAAKGDYEDALATQIKVSDANLTNALNTAIDSYKAASVAYDLYKASTYQNAVDATNVNNQAYFNMTNAAALAAKDWVVDYEDLTQAKGNGATNLVNELKTNIRKATEIKYNGKEYGKNKADVIDMLEGFASEEKATAAAYASLVKYAGECKKTLDKKQEAVATAATAMSTARKNWDNRVTLQAEAERNVLDKELNYQDAKIDTIAAATALKAAGCTL